MKKRIEGYFDHFPPIGMNVKTSTKEIGTTEGPLERKLIRRILVPKKGFKAGEVIYKVRLNVISLLN